MREEGYVKIEKGAKEKARLKCEKVRFQNEKWVKGEGLDVVFKYNCV